jgi:hypothetical protein
MRRIHGSRIGAFEAKTNVPFVCPTLIEGGRQADSMFRRLFDMAYVDGGCVGEPPPGTIYDDTAGCYVTNYVICVVGIIGGVAICCHSGAGSSYRANATAFFLSKGLGYGIAGLLHQFIHTTHISAEHEMWWTLSFVLAMIGNAALAMLAIQLCIDTFPLTQCGGNTLYTLTLILNVGAIIATFITGSMVLVGVASVVTLVFTAAMFGFRAENYRDVGAGNALAALIMALGFVLQQVLNQNCGDPGYADCWKACILPAPAFNHNALFHVLVAIGMTILAINMTLEPDLLDEHEKKGYAEFGIEDDDVENGDEAVGDKE